MLRQLNNYLRIQNKLEDVREKKLVKPVALTLLPNEIKMIESTKKEKNFLFKSFYL